MSLENQINTIFKIYPWALDAVLIEAVKIQGASNTLITQAISNLKTGEDLDPDKLANEVLAAFKENKSLVAAKKLSARTNSLLSKLVSSADPIGGFAGAIEEIAWSARDVTDAAADGTRRIRGLGGALRGIDLAALSLAGSATLLKIMLNFARDQEKTARIMIDYGLIATDQSIYRTLRDNFAGIGLSQAEAMTLLGNYGKTISSLANDSVSGFTNFSDFVESYSKNDSLGRFGYRGRELMVRLAEEATLLNSLNEITELNATAKLRISKGFQTSAALATRYAELTGQQRDNLLDMRRTALSDSDAIIAFNKNAQYMSETYGEGATERARTSFGQLSMLLPMLGEDISKGLLDGLTRAQMDVNINESAIDNISSEIFRQFQILGPEIANMVSEIFTTSITGSYTSPDQLTTDWQKLIIAIQNVPPLETYTPENEGAVQIQAMAQVVPDAFTKASGADLTARIETIAETITGGADDAVIAMDSMRTSLLEMYDSMTPSIGNINTGFSKLTSLFGYLAGMSDEEITDISRVVEQRNETSRSAATQESIRRRSVMEQIEGMTPAEAQTFMEDYARRSGYSYTGTGFVPLNIRDSTAEEIQALQREGGILAFIGKGEGSYAASNRGTINNTIVGSTMNTIRNGKSLTDMTFAEIFMLQSIDDAANPNRLFAVGRYQIIPETMQEIWPHSGLKLTDKFTPENQDKLGTLLLVGAEDGYTKRRNLSAYIRGESDNLEAAMLDFAMEWASAPDPRTGMSYYGSGNRASHSVQEVATALQAARADYAASRSLVTAETITPSNTAPTLTPTETVPPRPWMWNGYIPSSPRSAQSIWDRQYGATHNTDGTPKNTGDSDTINTEEDIDNVIRELTVTNPAIVEEALKLVEEFRRQNSTLELTR